MVDCIYDFVLCLLKNIKFYPELSFILNLEEKLIINLSATEKDINLRYFVGRLSKYLKKHQK